MTYIKGTTAADLLDGTAGDDLIEGLGDEDIIDGKDGADTLRGGEGDDQLVGGAGNDLLDGGPGNDLLDGGDGDDLILADVGYNTISGGAGDDRLEIDGGTIRYDTMVWGSMDSGIDNVVLDYSDYTENLWVEWYGSWAGSKTLYVLGGVIGNEEMVTISGVERMSVTSGSGDDTIYIFSPDGVSRTGTGNDRVISLKGLGSEWVTLGGSADGGEGIDRATLNWSDLGPGQNVVYDTADPAGTMVATEAGDRFLRGFEVLEEFHSGQGADRLTVHATGLAGVSQSVYAEGGDDVVTVVAGAEPLGDYYYAYLGGQAEDHLVVDFRASTVGASSYGGYHEQGGEFFLNGYTYGRETILGSDHDDVFRDGDTWVTNDIFFGGGGDDVLRVAYGDDEAHGGTGTDRLEVQLDSASGVEGIHFAAGGTPSSDGLGGYEGSIAWSSGSVLYTSVENFTVYGSGGADHIVGGDGEDVLYGSYSSDILEGGAGDDHIDGGLQSDRMLGGTGDDIYVSDGVGDEIVENAGEGTDEVRTAQAPHGQIG